MTEDFAIEHHFPFDGPHDAASVVTAARSLAELVRYLNNATGPGNGRMTLEWAATVHSVLGGVGGAINGLDQLIGQLAQAMRQQAADPTLYDDRRDRPARATAVDLAEQLDDLREGAVWLGRHINRAQSLSVHLGNRVGDEA